VADLQRQLDELRGEIAGGRGPQGAGNPGIDPSDRLPTGLPVVRGGGWDQSAPFQRVSARFSYYGPTLRVSDIGVRVVREKVAPAP
jgi:formylglycine-generating enzyme required for sulfatase activity